MSRRSLSRCYRILRGSYVRSPDSGPSRIATLARVLFRVAIFIGWGYLLLRALATFGPTSDINNVDFNSDSAIPVLMANDGRPITIFNFYYYGADRWGGWPFLPMQVAGRVTGYEWTAQSIYAVQAGWLFVGALAIAGLSRRDGLVAGLAYLIALCLDPDGRYLIFELSQVYAWQTTALLLSWWALRRFFDRQQAAREGRYSWTAWAWLLASCGFSYLAIWSSVASVIFLSLMLALEIVRAWSRQSSPRVSRPLVTSGTFAAGSVVAATAIERLQKMAYGRFSLAHYGLPFSTEFALDTGHLAENFVIQLRLIATGSWWPLDVLAALLLVAMMAAGLYSVMRKNEAVRHRLRAALADDTLILAIAAAGIAALNFALAVSVSHVRLNGYDSRYLTLTNLFGPVGGLLTAFLLLKAVVSASRQRYFETASVVAAMAWLAVAFPKSRLSLEYLETEATALALALKAPHAVLMGDYWATYVFTALQGDAAMVPVTLEGSFTRTPWTKETARRANEVILACPRSSRGAPVSPPQTLKQYGRIFTLADAHWHESRDYAFALYVRQRR